MQMLGGFLILLGCFGMGLWYRQQFLGRLYTIRELIRILEQWISEIRYNGSTLPDCCRQTGRQRKDRLGEICTEVYREYAETEDAGFLELAEKSFRRQLRMLPLKKEDIEECANCPASENCKGGCRARAVFESGSLRGKMEKGFCKVTNMMVEEMNHNAFVHN